MNKILVAYTTNAGSTEDVARAIAEELGKDGAQVEVRRLEEVTDLEPYAAAAVGGPMILGWHRKAVEFLKKNQAALSQKKVALFMTAMALTDTGERQFEGIPLSLDPGLALAPKNGSRLSLKENYARASSYLSPVLKAAPKVRPVSIAFFGGKLQMYTLNIFQALFVMLVVQAKPGDRRNWPFIREWAARLRVELQEKETA
ncbi:MAG TPA: flavodoxin domain-containing protein [Anaerolineaceae bacterium]|nr:flavodoxin domain-containing protein [Anaerolineaceae bacterium]